jgi:hypothetical protein
LAAAIEIAKKYEKSALLSGKWAEKQKKKKVCLAISDSSTDEKSDKEDKKSSMESKQAPLAKVVKAKLQTLRQAIEDVKIQMSDIKKSRRPIPVSRTNVCCTSCKKEGHWSYDCKEDWRMIQQVEADKEVDDHERKEAEAIFAIQLRQFQEEWKQKPVPKIPGNC